MGTIMLDLPVFLEEIAKERLKKKIVDHEIVGYTAMNECDSTEDTILQYHFARRAVAFCGRTEEMQALLAYLTDARSCLWWAITGQAGSGKKSFGNGTVIPTSDNMDGLLFK